MLAYTGNAGVGRGRLSCTLNLPLNGQTNFKNFDGVHPNFSAKHFEK